MTRFLFSLAVLAIATNLGFAQTKEIQEQLDKQLKELRTEDELLRQALASHPDVLVAQAKRQVAEAELAQVKLALAQKFSKLELDHINAALQMQTANREVTKLIELRRKGASNNDEVDKAQFNAQLAGEHVKQVQKEMHLMAPYPDTSKDPNPPKTIQRRSWDQHPDALAALAKLRVADAELAQTKLVISQKIATLKAEIDAQKQKLAMYETAYNEMQKRHQAGTAAKSELMPAQIHFLESRTALTRLNSELKGMTDLTQSRAVLSLELSRPALPSVTKDGPSRDKQVFLESKPTPGSPADLLKGILDKKVKFESKALPAAAVIRSLKEKYGLDVMIRMPLLDLESGFPLERITISVSPGEMTFTTWLELIVDDLNSKMNQEDMKFVVTVREYGLLITPEKLVPRDAVTLKDFARQVRAEKEKEKASNEAKKP